MCERTMKGDCFYLGFNRHTGELVHVVPPEGRKLTIDPRKVKLFSLGILGDKEDDSKIDPDDIKKQLEFFNERLKKDALAPILLTFVDDPGSSPCGGSCGGVPFYFCGLP